MSSTSTAPPSAPPAGRPVPGSDAHEALARGVLTLSTTLLGLAAGFFYAYESSVTRGTALVDDGTYVATMDAINATVRNPLFAVSFFGALVTSAVALAVVAGRGQRARTAAAAGALVLYAVTFGITMAVSVPMNRALAEGVASGVDATELRADYEEPWNRANRLRTGTATAALVASAVALGTRRPRERA